MTLTHSLATLRTGKVPRASVDLITIQDGKLPAGRRNAAALNGRFDGKVKLPCKTIHPSYRRWLTIHDPSAADLVLLTVMFPDARVSKLEVSMDWHPLVGESIVDTQHRFDTLRKCMNPAAARALQEGAITRQYDGVTYMRVTRLKGHECRFTTLVGAEDAHSHVRLYIKDRDEAGRVPFVRLEATLLLGGPQQHGLQHLSDWRGFVPRLCRVFAPFLSIGDGFVPVVRVRQDKARRSVTREGKDRRIAEREGLWDKHGARYLDGRKGKRRELRVTPDAAINRKILEALRVLQRRLQRALENQTGPEKVVIAQSNQATLGFNIKPLQNSERVRYRSGNHASPLVEDSYPELRSVRSVKAPLLPKRVKSAGDEATRHFGPESAIRYHVDAETLALDVILEVRSSGG